MKTITFFGKLGDPRIHEARLLVADSTVDHLSLNLNGQSIKLNAVQVDKLRQVFHGWLHERALGADGLNWIEEEG